MGEEGWFTVGRKLNPETLCRQIDEGTWSWFGVIAIHLPDDGEWHPRSGLRDAAIRSTLQMKGFIEVTDGTMKSMKERFSEAVRDLKQEGLIEARGMNEDVEMRWVAEGAEPFLEPGPPSVMLGALSITRDYLRVDHDGTEPGCHGCTVLRAVSHAAGFPVPRVVERAAS